MSGARRRSWTCALVLMPLLFATSVLAAAPPSPQPVQEALQDLVQTLSQADVAGSPASRAADAELSRRLVALERELRGLEPAAAEPLWSKLQALRRMAFQPAPLPAA